MRIFVVEDASQTRQELITLLASVDGLEIVGAAGSVSEAITGIEATAPEVVILDILLSDGSGVEVLKHCRQLGSASSVVVLTGNLYDALRIKCEQLGAVAVLDKINGLAQVREVAAGLQSDFKSGSNRSSSHEQ
jgi:two-component system, NarL family, response regulator DevR